MASDFLVKDSYLAMGTVERLASVDNLHVESIKRHEPNIHTNVNKEEWCCGYGCLPLMSS
jgi:hypothetical protein